MDELNQGSIVLVDFSRKSRRFVIIANSLCIIFFMKNPGTHSQTQQHSSQLPKNPGKPCHNPQFSDVIELAGNSGIP